MVSLGKFLIMENQKESTDIPIPANWAEAEQGAMKRVEDLERENPNYRITVKGRDCTVQDMELEVSGRTEIGCVFTEAYLTAIFMSRLIDQATYDELVSQNPRMQK